VSGLPTQVLAEIAKRHDDERIRAAARAALIERILEREGLT
jgi:hypothetical protein